MDQGHILQLGTPAELYDTPADVTVARFIGSPPINLIEAVAGEDGTIRLAGVVLHAPRPGRFTVGIRPEALRLAPPASGLLAARLRRAENLGAEWLLHADSADGVALAIRMTAAEHAAAAALIGGTVHLAADRAATHLFTADGRRVAAGAAAAVPA
nr:TOBE domain-containing protein [Roseomonas rosulenta]